MLLTVVSQLRSQRTSYLTFTVTRSGCAKLILLPLLPLITVLGMVTIRCRGPYPVGVAEVQHTFNLPTFASGGLTADEMLRLRVFYPAVAEEPRRFPRCLLPRRRQGWPAAQQNRTRVAPGSSRPRFRHRSPPRPPTPRPQIGEWTKPILARVRIIPRSCLSICCKNARHRSIDYRILHNIPGANFLTRLENASWPFGLL